MINEELDIVQTCGLCEMIISQRDVETHPCLEGYTKYYTDPLTLYFYPMTDDERTIIKKTYINEGLNTVNKENSVNTENLSSNQHLKRNLSPSIPEQRNKKTYLSFDEEEVQKREPLWNFQLNEVSDALNGLISPEAAKIKFKSLHDIYRKIVQAEQKPSESGRTRTTRLWQHYNNMEFMRDSCLIKTTVSNISDAEILENSEITSNVPSANRSNNLKETTAIERIANAFCDASNNNEIVLPPPPQPDDIDSFLNLLGSRIRQLHEVQKQEAFQKHLQLSYDMLQNM